jgi:hypothetical protein
MKKKSLSIVLAIACAFAFMGASCPNAQRNEYKAIYAVELSASLAVDDYFRLVIEGIIPTNDVPIVSQKFNQIQAAGTLAAAASRAGTNGLAPASLVIELTDLTTFISTIKNK